MNVMNDPDQAKLSDLLSMFDLSQDVHVPTHKSGNTVYLIITRSNQELLLNKVITDYMLPDHMFVGCDINIPRPTLRENNITYRKLSNIDQEAFSSDLKLVTNSLMCVHDVIQLALDYNTRLRYVLDKHAPIRRKIIIKRPCVPWFDHDLKDVKACLRRHGVLIKRKKVY